MKRWIAAGCAMLAFGGALAQDRPAGATEATIEATTATGVKVYLLPDGKWEYAEPAKAALQREERRVEEVRERSAQGGFFGLGRKINEGDPAYNRGSLNPKLR